MVHGLGTFSALVPIGLFVWGVTAFAGLRSWRPGWRELIGSFLVLSASGLFYKAFGADPVFGGMTKAGGIVGYGATMFLDDYLGDAGSWVLLGVVFLAAFVAITGFSFRKAISGLMIAHLWFFPRVFALLGKAARIAIWVGVFAVKKIFSMVMNFSFTWRAEKPGTAAMAGHEDEKTKFFDYDHDESENTEVVPPQEETRELLVVPDHPSPQNRKNRRRIARSALQNGPSLFGGGEFVESLPLSEPRTPVLFGPAAEKEESGRSRGSGVVPAGSGKELAEEVRLPESDDFEEVGELPSADVQESDSRSPAAEETPKETEDVAQAMEDVADDVNKVRTPRKSVFGGVRITRRKNRAEDGDSSPETREEVLVAETWAEGLEDETSPDVEALAETKTSTPELEQAEQDMKVRHAGLEGEAEIVRIQDDSLVKSVEGTEKEKSNRPTSAPGPEKKYALPSLDIFAAPPSGGLIVDEAGIREKSLLLEQTLKEFGVVGKVREVKTGPVITIFEYDPAPGIKVSKITGLADDLARALSALSVRIVAPIPGKSVVGIEVPNAKRDAVFAKEVLSSTEFRQAEDKLTMGLGKDILGRTALTDLAKIPHLLIAGTTGSGKSVALNMMICSLLAKCTPREVRFLMIDPKMLELSIYEGIPHQLVPVVTDPKKAAAGLRGVLVEMERRYRLMSEAGVRNIQSYNASVARQLGERETKKRLEAPLSEEEVLPDFLPYIVVVIDELADLMMVAPREVEESMTRLAQMARASGIHLLVATQRPSVDVLTGLIKANFPSRMALRVATRTDSRTILDANGAERLLGKGDMLFVPPGSSISVRIHGAYVSDEEISQLVEHWKSQGAAIFEENWFVEAESASANESGDEEEYDERYDDAIALVARTREASISLIQRHLRIGYNRAARMIERMEQEGIIGPADGVKRRQVLVNEIPGEEAVEVS